MIPMRLPLFVLCLLSAFCSPMVAQEAAPFPVTLELGKKESDTAILGLKLDIHAPWHVYAFAPPGEEGFGYPPDIQWDQSQNVKLLKVEWPVPEKDEMETGETAYVYTTPQTIPLEVTFQNQDQLGTVRLKVSFLACAEMCVPVETILSISLPAGNVQGDESVLKAHKAVELQYEGMPTGMLILFALLGGLILNFMPCVLPILSMKLLGLVKHAKHDDVVRAKKGFLLSSLGILLSFLLLGLIAIALKASGEAVGWGIHFQNPYFLTFMFAVLFLFSASFWGIFDFQLPEVVNHWILSEKSQGYSKDLLMGMFATLLATPCSAPFVGSAVGFALAHETPEILLVFLMLGVGFSAPYWIAGILPERFLWLPKPGAWMLKLERVLAFGLTLSVVWIGFLLASHIPLWGIIVITVILALIALMIRRHEQGKLWTFRTTALVGGVALLGILTSPQLFFKGERAATAPSVETWQPFDPEKISQWVTQGKIVFVDITADWCMTCKANKEFVLNGDAVKRLLTSPQVITMQGDWTKQDVAITTFLQTYGRYGIPFNIVFGPNHPEGIALPELLSEKGIENAFKTVGFSFENSPNTGRK